MEGIRRNIIGIYLPGSLYSLCILFGVPISVPLLLGRKAGAGRRGIPPSARRLAARRSPCQGVPGRAMRPLIIRAPYKLQYYSPLSYSTLSKTNRQTVSGPLSMDSN